MTRLTSETSAESFPRLALIAISHYTTGLTTGLSDMKMLRAFAPSLSESICHQNRACVSTRIREGTQIFEVSNDVGIFVVERLRNPDPSLQCTWPTLPNLPINRNQFETATLCPLSSYLDDISRGGKVQQLGQASFRVAKCELVRHLQPSKNAPHFAIVATIRNIQSQFFRN